MLDSSEELLPFDPEPERTLRKRLGRRKHRVAKMGEENLTLRDHWIPANQGFSAVVQPTIQANNFELKPALINMV